jgi:hypothetical protein
MLDDKKCDRLACATLLRLLSFDDDAFSDQRLRGSTALFDRVLAKTLYAEADLKDNSQTFEKRDRLRTRIVEHEQALTTLVKSLSSIDGINSFRPSFGKLLNSKPSRAYVLPFLPEGVTTQTFEELLTAVQAISSSSDAEMIEDADRFYGRCAELTEAAESLGSHYSELLVIDFTDTLQTLVRAHVAAAGFSDPAHLSFQLRAKRYPFNQVGNPITVRLDLVNEGPGQAQEVSVEIEGGGTISFSETSKAIGLMGPGSRLIEFHGETTGSNRDANHASDVLGVKISWRNSDRTDDRVEDVVTLEGQDGDLAWDDLMLKEPYRLEPVADRGEFIGQDKALRDLTKVVLQSGNARIQGEKRVGKTSLANAVSATVNGLADSNVTFINFEAGDFNATTAEGTVTRLGELIAKRVRNSDERLRHLDSPDLSQGLMMLTELFADAAELAPDRRYVIILDEFDAMSHPALYRHEPLGDALFQTLRSLGGKKNVSFILVGGERMQWVIAVHGQALNKFKLVPLDYFDEDQFEDFSKLVSDPVADVLTFSDEAVEVIHHSTAGNPWMTKLLLSELFERQVQRRDRDVKADDVLDAINDALPKLGAQSFQHFWDDAIQGDGDERHHVSTMRRRVLLAFGRCLQGRERPTEELLVRTARDFSVDEPTTRDVLRGLCERRILRVDAEGVLRCRMPLFELWLPKYGAQEIMLGSGDDDTLIRRQRSIEEMRPKFDEIAPLVKRWGSYRGEDLHHDQVAAWLEQFGGPKEQRLVFPILEGLRFYTRSSIYSALRNLHSYVLRELAARGYEYTLSGKQRLRNDFLVCGLEGGGSGAGHLLKWYRDENGIYSDCAVDPPELRNVMDSARQEIRAVILLEDLIGTGKTASGCLTALHELWTENEDWPEGVDVFLLSVAAFEQGRKKAEHAASQVDWPLTIRSDDILGVDDRCFHEQSRFFDDDNLREEAKALCSKVGSGLTPKTPLGFGDSEAAICFEYRCPNNSLPILWNNSTSWDALFPRL